MNKNIGVYPAYVQHYLDLVDTSDLAKAFESQGKIILHLLESIDEQKSTFAYAENKWTLKELLQHCIDAERIFCYRALCFARKEPAILHGFDEDSYAANSNASNRSWQSLKEEFKAVRKSSELLFGSFSEEILMYSGKANNNESSVISIGFLIIGHLNHHINIVNERYIR